MTRHIITSVCILRLIDMISDWHSLSAPAVSMQRRSHQHNSVRITLGLTFIDVFADKYLWKGLHVNMKNLYLDRHILIRLRLALHRVVNFARWHNANDILPTPLARLKRWVIKALSGEKTNKVKLWNNNLTLYFVIVIQDKYKSAWLNLNIFMFFLHQIANF